LHFETASNRVNSIKEGCDGHYFVKGYGPNHNNEERRMKYWFLGLFALICACNVFAIDSRMVGDWYDDSSLALEITQGEILIYPQIVDASFIEEMGHKLELGDDGISAYWGMSLSSGSYRECSGISIQFCPLFDNVLLVIVDSSYYLEEYLEDEGYYEYLEDENNYENQRTYLLTKH
jgi:hypothetical protein